MKTITKKELKQLHKRLQDGEHILFVNYGNLNREIFSCWYTEDKIGKYLQIVGVKNSEIFSPSEMVMRSVLACNLRAKEDIRNFEAYNSELRFLELENLTVENDSLTQDERKVSDYMKLLSLTKKDYLDKAPYSIYKDELNNLVSH